MGHTIINIGRQFGSGGRRIAASLSGKLGIPVYDNELISEAAQKSGYSKELFQKRDEHRSLFTLSNIFGTTNRYSGGESYLNDNTLFKIQSEVMREIAEKDPQSSWAAHRTMFSATSNAWTYSSAPLKDAGSRMLRSARG